MSETSLSVLLHWLHFQTHRCRGSPRSLMGNSTPKKHEALPRALLLHGLLVSPWPWPWRPWHWQPWPWALKLPSLLPSGQQEQQQQQLSDLALRPFPVLVQKQQASERSVRQTAEVAPSCKGQVTCEASCDCTVVRHCTRNIVNVVRNHCLPA